MAINKLDTGAIQDNAITNAKMADDAVGVADLAATGTPSSTTFLRGDNAWVTPTDTNTTYSVQDGELSQNNFTNDDHTKLNNIEASADVTDATNVAAAGAVMTQYVHPNHSGDVTSTADGATVIGASKVITSMILDDNVTAAKLANSINTDIATGVTGNTTANAALPKAGGAMTGTITGFTSTGIDDNANANAITIDLSENVGIGTTSIDTWTKLKVAGTAGAQDVAKQALYVTSPTATANEGVGIRFSAASGSHEAVGIIGMVNNASGNAGSMVFHTYDGGGTIPERMRIDNTGRVTMPYQPAFMASTDGFVTSTTTYSDLMVMAIEALDVGNNFSLSTSRFTAPIAGVYMLHGTIEFENGNASDWKGANFMINGSTLAHDFNGGNMVSGSNSGDTVSYIVSLSAGDYVSLVADSWNGTYNYRASFGGHLIG